MQVVELTELERKEHVAPEKPPVVSIHGGDAFSKLDERQKKYALYLTLAANAGYTITVQQNSEYALDVFHLIERIVDIGFEKLKELVLQVAEEEQYKTLLEYFVKFLYETGTYDSFGDKKFIPNLPADVFEKIVCHLDKSYPGLADLFKAVKNDIYDLSSEARVIALPPTGKTIYYKGMNKEEIEAIHKFQNGKLGYENTMVSKEVDNDGMRFVIHVASIEHFENSLGKIGDIPVVARGGLFSSELTHSVKWLKEAIKYAANDIEKHMLEQLIHHYTTGSLAEHIEYSKTWVKDTNPDVETYGGFVETYRDPMGVRAEFEHFIAAKDKESSAILAKLVEEAPTIIPLLPWGKALENTAFKAPDFTGINIISFVTNGFPIGINIPNYDEIRHGIGFKNVSLQNVMKASMQESELEKKPSYKFLTAADTKVYRKHESLILDLHVALHELYGHGTGKLLSKKDVEELIEDEVINYATNDKFSLTSYAGVPLYYDPDVPERSNYNNVFGSIASSWEECRAEAVALFLSTEPFIQDIFHIPEEDREASNRVSWLMFIQMGLTSTPMYNVQEHQWKQAHCLARFMIMKWLVSMCPTSVFIRPAASTEDGGETGYVIDVNMANLESHLRPALAQLLCKLTGFKATADAQSAREFVATYAAIDSRYLAIREAVVKTIKARKIYQQPTLILDGEELTLKDMPVSLENYIKTIVGNHKVASE